MTDLYELLGVQRSASQREIKSAYRRLARKYHPDVNPDPASVQKFATVTDAYHVLVDPQRRKIYDIEGVTLERSAAQQEQQSARAARRAYYQAQADKAVNEWLARERLETKIRGHAVFTMVSLFVTTFAVAIIRPRVIELTNPLWYTIVIVLFAASIFHLILILKRHFDHYTYRQELVSVMQERKNKKPFTRKFAFSFLLGGYLASLIFGLAIGMVAEDLTRDFSGETTLLDALLSVLFYPPIAVLIVDTMYIISLRLEEL